MAKAALWSVTDADVRKRGDQTGLDTLVVHAVNDHPLRSAMHRRLGELLSHQLANAPQAHL